MRAYILREVFRRHKKTFKTFANSEKTTIFASNKFQNMETNISKTTKKKISYKLKETDEVEAFLTYLQDQYSISDFDMETLKLKMQNSPIKKRK